MEVEMTEIKLAKDAQDVLDKFLVVFPSASRKVNREKALKGVALQLLTKGAAEADRDMVLEAIEDMFPKSFEPLTMRLRDMQALAALAESQKEISQEHPVVKVRRWDIPQVTLDRPVKKVLALLAGPRKKGNTDSILDAVLKGVNEAGCPVEKLSIPDITISPCIGCMACEAKELETYCAIKDDMTDIYRRFLECDAFVLGFPVYTARECSQAAAFLDRLKALRSPGNYKKLGKLRKGTLVVTWGWPTENAYNHVVENVAFVLKLYGVETAEIVTGSGFWEAYYKKGTAQLDEKGITQAKEAGTALVLG
jgi:multimeric flavodoxin WrbA